MLPRMFLSTIVGSLGLSACQLSPKHSPEAAAQFLLGQDAGLAMTYFGHPSHGSPPSATGAVLTWQAAHVLINPQGGLIPAYPPSTENTGQDSLALASMAFTPKTMRWQRCVVRLQTDAQFTTTQVSVQDCHSE